jgi:8-oxo-dGTP pyrophosphatase MutT (NUDIX family)
VTADAPGRAAKVRAVAHRRLRDDATARLAAWSAPDDAQDRLRQHFLEHVLAHEDATAKDGPPAHLTASVIVLSPDGRSALLTHHRRARQWFQFGGHLEPGDVSLWHAATREAREESGLQDLQVLAEIVQLDRHDLDGDFGRCRAHLDVRFVAVAPEGTDHAVSDESLDVRWWPVDGLPAGTRDELRPLVDAALRITRR